MFVLQNAQFFLTYQPNRLSYLTKFWLNDHVCRPMRRRRSLNCCIGIGHVSRPTRDHWRSWNIFVTGEIHRCVICTDEFPCDSLHYDVISVLAESWYMQWSSSSCELTNIIYGKPKQLCGFIRHIVILPGVGMAVGMEITLNHWHPLHFLVFFSPPYHQAVRLDVPPHDLRRMFVFQRWIRPFLPPTSDKTITSSQRAA